MKEKLKKFLLWLASPIYGAEISKVFQSGEFSIKENYDRLHAKTALQQFFFHAKTEIVLLCRKLSADVYEHISTMLFLYWAYARNHKLKLTVLVRSKEEDVESLGFRAFLLAHNAALYEGVEDGKLFPRVARVVKDLPDFCLVDGKHARIEIDKDTRAAQLYINAEDEPPVNELKEKVEVLKDRLKNNYKVRLDAVLAERMRDSQEYAKRGRAKRGREFTVASR